MYVHIFVFVLTNATQFLESEIYFRFRRFRHISTTHTHPQSRTNQQFDTLKRHSVVVAVTYTTKHTDAHLRFLCVAKMNFENMENMDSGRCQARASSDKIFQNLRSNFGS